MTTAIAMKPCRALVLALTLGTLASAASASLLRLQQNDQGRHYKEAVAHMAASKQFSNQGIQERRLIGENDSCLATSSFDVSVVDCTLADIEGAIDTLIAGNAECGSSTDELALLLGVETGDLSNAISAICTAAEEAETTSDALSFEDVLGEGYQFQKEFFDGNKWLNEERETIDEHGVTNNVLEHDAYRILDTYEDAAQEKVIKFPSEQPVFDSCEVSAVMCCWVACRGAGCVNDVDPVDNTDVCYVDMARAPQSNHVTAGFAIFDGAANDDEGNAYCHGFAWGDDTSDDYKYRGNALFHVSLYNNLFNKGYVRKVPGAPMCGCVDKMPVVTKSACTKVSGADTDVTLSYNKIYNTVTATLNHEITYEDCGKDLKDHFGDVSGTTGEIGGTLVNNCQDAVGSFLTGQNLQRT